MTVEELLAREEIRHLMAVYNTAGDGGRREEFHSVFCEDAVLIAPGINLEGRENIVDGLFAGVDTPQPTTRAKPKFVRHNLTTSKITFTSATTAVGRTYFMVVTDAGLDHCGVYSDQFRKDDDGWKIAHRVVRSDYVSADSRFDLGQ